MPSPPLPLPARRSAVLALTLCLAGAVHARAPLAITLEPEVNLSASAEASTLNEVSPQAVALDAAGRLVVVWSEFAPDGGTPELMARVRQPDGNWSQRALLTERDGRYSGDAALATLADGRIAMAWVDHGRGDFEIRLAILDPAALKLVESEAVSDPSPLVMEPAIAAGPRGELAVAWTVMEEMNYELKLRRRPASGGFGPVEAVTPRDGRASDQIALAYAPDGRLHLAWADSRSGARRIYTGSLGPGEVKKPVAVSPFEGEGKQSRPTIAVDGQGRVHIAWQETRGGNEEVLVVAATESGFTAPFRPGQAGAISRSPCLVAAESGLHLLWEDGRHSQGETASIQIYYARLGPERVSEVTPVTTDLPASCFNPNLVAGSAGTLHLVWRNTGFGEGEIIYRQGLASGPWAPR